MCVDICALVWWRSQTVPCNDHVNPIWIDTVYFGMPPILEAPFSLPPDLPLSPYLQLPTHVTSTHPKTSTCICTGVQCLRWGGGDVSLILAFKPQCVRPPNPLLAMIFFSCLSFLFEFKTTVLLILSSSSSLFPTTQILLSLLHLLKMSACHPLCISCLLSCCFVFLFCLMSYLLVKSISSCLSLKSSLPFSFSLFYFFTSVSLVLSFSLFKLCIPTNILT